MSRIDSSVVLITDSRVTRADYVGRNAAQLLNFYSDERVAGSSFGDALESAAAKRKPIGRKTLILDTSIWSQLVSIPRLSVVDVEPEELESALKFEVETLSGIDADQAVLGIRALESSGTSSDQQYWVNVATNKNVELAAGLLKPLGAKWIGLAHPGGFTSTSNLKSPQLIELWQDLAVLLERGQIKSIASRSGYWHKQFQFDSWDELRAQAELVVESVDVLPTELKCSETCSLQEEGNLKHWLQSVASRASKDELDSLPIVVRSHERTKSSQQRLLRRVALAGLVLLLCLAHYHFLKQQQNNLEAQNISLQQPAQQKRNYDAQLAKLLQQRSVVEQDAAVTLTQVRQIEFLFVYQTGRWEQFLDLLLNSRTADLLIEEIAHHEKGVVVKGFSLGGNSAPLLANRLREQAIPLGWRIHAPTQIGEQKMISGGPWQFTILFEDVGPGANSFVGQSTTVKHNVTTDNETF